MKRYHQEIARTRKEWRKHLNVHYVSVRNIPNVKLEDTIDCPCDLQPGRFRKIKNNDCGHTRCYACHEYKYPKRELTPAEIRFEISYLEQLAELS